MICQAKEYRSWGGSAAPIIAIRRSGLLNQTKCIRERALSITALSQGIGQSTSECINAALSLFECGNSTTAQAAGDQCEQGFR